MDWIILTLGSLEYVLSISITLLYYLWPSMLPAKSSWNKINQILYEMGLQSQLYALVDNGYVQTITVNLAHVFFFINLLLFPITFYSIFSEIKKAKARHLNYFTGDTFHFYQWNYRFMIVVLICGVYVLSVIFYSFNFHISVLARSLSFFLVGIGGICCGILAYYNPSMYGKEENFAKFLEHLSSPKTNSPQQLEAQKADQYPKYKKQLIELMEKKTLYRDPTLSLSDVADQLQISSRHLSRIINTEFAKSFSEFINEYRIAEVKKHLTDLQFEHYAILSIGLEAGFNSKSSFYSTFKKYTGQNPAAFRKSKMNHST